MDAEATYGGWVIGAAAGTASGTRATTAGSGLGWWIVVFAAFTAVCACGETRVPVQTTAVDSGGGADAVDLDARMSEADAFVRDAGVVDAAVPDGGTLDAASAPDATPVDTGGWAFPPRSKCAAGYRAPRSVGTPDDAELTEVSGIVASPSNPGVLWLHNDSGDSPRLFAIADDGTALGRVNLPAMITDLEDIAVAACPDQSGPCLWIADTGDNDRVRAEVAIYAVPEPPVDSMVPFGELDVVDLWRFPFELPLGAIDSEALIVMPDASALYLIEKLDDARAQIYRHEAPWQPDTLVALERVGTMASPGLAVVRLGRMITGADLHPSGERIILRVYTGVFEYRLDPGSSPAALTQASPLRVPITLEERQGEAIAYDEVGTGLWSMSEGVMQRLHHYECLD